MSEAEIVNISDAKKPKIVGRPFVATVELRWNGSQLEQKFIQTGLDGVRAEEWRVVPNKPLSEAPESAIGPVA